MGPGRLAGTAQVEGTECWPMQPEAWAAWRAHMGWERRGGRAQGSAGPVSTWPSGTPEQGARGLGQGLSQPHWMETETTPRASTLHAAVRQLQRRAGSPHLTELEAALPDWAGEVWLRQQAAGLSGLDPGRWAGGAPGQGGSCSHPQASGQQLTPLPPLAPIQASHPGTCADQHVQQRTQTGR